MKVDYICTLWPLGPDKGPSAASHPASCVFLISYCFSQREGHLLIDCLNPLQINTAGSLCDAYPSSPPRPSTCLQQARRVKETPSNQSSLPSSGSVGHHIYFIVCRFFMITERHKAEWCRKPVVDPQCCSDALYELWNDQGYLTSQPNSSGIFQHILLI